MKTRDFLRGLGNLSKQEMALIERFEADPTGAGFSAVADLLRKRGHVIEAIVILEDGLSRFPKVASARAALASDYLSQGMFDESLREALAVIESAPDNALAHRLALRLLINADRQSEALDRLAALARLVPDDPPTASLRKLAAAGDWAGAKQLVRREWELMGLAPEAHHAPPPTEREAPVRGTQPTTAQTELGNQPPEGSAWVVPLASSRASAHEDFAPAPLRAGAAVEPLSRAAAAFSSPSGATGRPDSTRDSNDPEALRPGASLAHVRGDEDRYLLLRGFRPVSIDGYLMKQEISSTRGEGVEKSTLAELYRSQGMVLRALEIYGELLREQPSNSSYQVIYEELRNQLKRDLQDTPAAKTAPENNAPSNAEGTGARRERIEKLRSLLSQIDAQKTDR